MRHIEIRKLVAVPNDVLYDNVTGSVPVLYEDGNKVVLERPIAILDAIFLKTLLKYPKIKIPETISSHHHLSNGAITSSTHTSLCSSILRLIVEHVPDEEKARVIDQECLEMYKGITEVTNKLMRRLYGDTFSISILDFIRLQQKKEISEAMEKTRKEMTGSSISETYKVIDNVIDSDESVANNSVVKAARFGMVSRNQLLQCIGPRGYVTDVDFSIFPYPVVRSFTEGMQNLYNILVESRSAAKALYLSNKDLSDSEYFSRRLQLAIMVVKSAVIGDCGSEDYIAWHVRGKEVADDGTVISNGDLPNMVGKYYLNETTGKLEVITKDREDLVGKTILLRHVKGCKLKDSKSVCSTCGGDILLNVPAHANLGHYSVTTMASQASQNILSTKHLDANAAGTKIVLSPEDKKFLRSTKDKYSYTLRPSRKFAKLELVVPRDSIPLIVEVTESSDFWRTNIYRISRVDKVLIRLTDKDGNVTEYLGQLGGKGKEVAFSNQFLKHIKDTGYTISESAYVIDVTNWDQRLPLATLKKTEYNHSTHAGEIAKMLVGGVGELSRNGMEYAGILSMLFELVNSKLRVNLTFLEVILYGLSYRDKANADFRLAREVDTDTLGGVDDVIGNRSWSAKMAFNDVHNIVYKPDAFIKSKMPDHPLDPLIAPYSFNQYHKR